MAKITVHGGASDASAEVAPPAVVDIDVQPEGVEPSPGSSFPTSSKKPENGDEPNDPRPAPRVRKTANRSSKARTGGSFARSTGGDPAASAATSDAEVTE